jgi:hypothetical protein
MFLVLTEIKGLSECVLYKEFYWLFVNKSFGQLNLFQFYDLEHRISVFCGKRNQFLE